MRLADRIKKKTTAALIVFFLFPLFFPACQQSFSETGKEAAQENGEEEKEGKDKKTPALPVKIAEIEEGAISSFLSVSSDLEAENHVEVFSRETGLIRSIDAMEGDRVEKDGILARIEDDELRLQADSARIAIENSVQAKEQAAVALDDSKEAVKKAKLLMEKSKRVFERSQKFEEITSEEEFEEKKYAYEQNSLDYIAAQFKAKRADLDLKVCESNVAKARNDLKLIEIRLNNTKIKAPIAGKVTDRFIREGQYVTANAKAFTIVNTDKLLTYVDIPQKELRVLKAGLEVEVTADALPGEAFRGKVRLVSPVIDPLSGTVKVTIDVLEGHDRLKPGMFIKTRITLENRENTLLIPKQAILFEPTGTAFFTLEENKAKKVLFLPGLEETHRMEIGKVLGDFQVKAGDPIITVGQNKLKDGDEVFIVDAAEAGKKETQEK